MKKKSIVFRRLFLQENLSQQNTNRIFSLDCLKAMSIIGVVSFHSILVPRKTYADSELLINLIFSPLRFCVPVFLTISFLLLEKGLVKPKDSIGTVLYKRLKRLLIPTLFWFFIAGLLKILNHNNVSEILNTMFVGEIFTGAYYLLILIQLTPIFILFRRWLNKPFILISTICLQSLIYIYIYTLPSISDHEYILRILKTIDRPLLIYWFIYMTFGAFLWKRWSFITKLSQQIPIKTKILLLISYSLAQMLEFYWCLLNFQGEIPPFDYVTFSCILSVLILFLCFASIQEDQLPIYISKLINLLSKYSLGIFCINGILSQILGSLSLRLFVEIEFNFYEILILKLVSWFFILTTSLGLSIFLDKIGLKAVVR